MRDFFSEPDCDGKASVAHDHKGQVLWEFKPSISLDKANRLLRERGQVVYGRVDGDHGWFDSSRTYCSLDGAGKEGRSTHTALLICVEPIVKDSAEKIVEDLAKHNFDGSLIDLIDRARALKENK